MLETIAQKYDALIVDLWGVVHDGSSLYPGVAEALAWLHAQKKTVVFLSNAPRTANHAMDVLSRLGVPREHYSAMVTSGQVTHDWLEKGAQFGRRYYYLGPEKDEAIITDLTDYTRVRTPEKAEFVLCTGHEYDFQPDAEIQPLLVAFAKHELPLLCANPDLEVVKQDGTEIPCAGVVAKHYEALGGRVTYVGKPFSRVYDVCRRLLGDKHVLAVGDNPATDIKGANDARIDTLLITGGVLKVTRGMLGPAEALAVCRAQGAEPNYVLPAFALGE